MSGARWKYRTEKVTVDENTVTVRGLTAGERVKFAEFQKERKEKGLPATDITRRVAQFGVIDPPLEAADLESMPGDLLDAAVQKIMELSGVKTDEKDEKKEAALH